MYVRKCTFTYLCIPVYSCFYVYNVRWESVRRPPTSLSCSMAIHVRPLSLKYICSRICTCIHIVYTYAHICIYVYMFIYVCIRKYTYIFVPRCRLSG